MARYFGKLIILIVTFLVLVGLFALAMDPYDFWDTPKTQGFNRIKPTIGKHLRIVKLRQFSRVAPRTVIAGNSRVQVGFDPLAPVWPEESKPVYNLGIAGIGLIELTSILLPLLEVGDAEELILGLDFLDFRLELQEWRQASEGWELPPSTANSTPLPRNIAEMIFSADALIDSAKTLYWQPRPFAPHVTPEGFDGRDNYNRYIASKGAGIMFAQSNEKNLAGFMAASKQISWPSRGINPNYLALARVVEFCNASGIRLIIFTYPYHADYLELLRLAGLWPAFEEWKSQLAAFSVKYSVQIRDFSDYNSFTTEAVPSLGDTDTHLAWYWEPGHFKAALGEIILSQILRPEEDDLRIGPLLSPEMIVQHLADLQVRGAKYRDTHATDLLRIEKLVEATR